MHLLPQADGTFLAREYRERAKGGTVNNTNWSINEASTTRDDSIHARVDNVPGDDDALNQGDCFDNKDRRVEGRRGRLLTTDAEASAPRQRAQTRDTTRP